MTPLATAFVVALIVALLTTGLWLRQRAINRDLQRRDAADRTRDTFLDLVSHELRSPLSAIIGYQELMADGAYGQIGDPALDPLARIGRSARHLLHLIDGIMDLALLRSGPLSANLDTIDLDPLAAAAARDFQAYADERQLRHSVHLDPGLPRIRSDHERLARALHLFVIAAVRSPAGEHLELRVERDPAGATIRIRGTSIVVPDDIHEMSPQTGIRLSVVAATAHLLGGDLRTEGGDGATADQVVLAIRAADGATPPDSPTVDL